MIIQLNEVTNKTSNLQSYGAGQFEVPTSVQRAMLTAFLNTAEGTLKTQAELKAVTGQSQPNLLPRIVVTYNKVTKAKARIENRDYRGTPGVAMDTHMGVVVKVARNKKGEVYFTILDENRTGTSAGFTAVRLEGIRSFSFADAGVQSAFLATASLQTA